MSDPGVVPVRRRKSRRRRRLRRLRWAASTALLAALLAIAWLIANRIHSSSQISQAKQPAANLRESLSVLATRAHLRLPANLSRRPAYRYSVIPGGVQAPEELRSVAARDQAVADHYAGFRYDRARVVRLQHAEMVYLSYRMNGRIYWTRTRHRIPAGETVITDGEITGRTRCANRLSVTKQLAVSPNEPPQEALNEVEPPPMLPPENVIFPAQYQSAVLTGITPGAPWVGPRTGDPWLLFPPPLPPGVGGGGGGGVCKPAVKRDADGDSDEDLGSDTDDDRCRPPAPPPTTVPEPSGWILLGSGIVALSLALRWKKAAALR